MEVLFAFRRRGADRRWVFELAADHIRTKSSDLGETVDKEWQSYVKVGAESDGQQEEEGETGYQGNQTPRFVD